MRSGVPAARAGNAGIQASAHASASHGATARQRAPGLRVRVKARGAARAMLFPHAEAREDSPEKIFARELPRDLAERALRRAQLLGHELARTPFGELLSCDIHMAPSACERLEV